MCVVAPSLLVNATGLASISLSLLVVVLLLVAVVVVMMIVVAVGV